MKWSNILNWLSLFIKPKNNETATVKIDAILCYIALCVLLLGAFNIFFLNTGKWTTLNIDIETNVEGSLKIFWMTSEHGYLKTKSKNINIAPGKNSYRTDLPILSSISRLRFSPIFEPDTNLIIHDITVQQLGYSAHLLKADNQRFPISNSNDLVLQQTDNKSLKVTTLLNQDPQFEIRMGYTKHLFIAIGLSLYFIICFSIARVSNLQNFYTKYCSINTVSAITFCYLCVFLYLQTPFYLTLERDAFYFLTKAFEISTGNWTPKAEQFMGWPIFLSLFISLFKPTTLHHGMIISRLVGIFLAALAVFPLAALSKKMMSNRFAAVVVVGYGAAIVKFHTAGEGMTEPFFFMLILGCISSLTNIRDDQVRGWLFAAVFAGCAYFVHAKGLFLVGVIEAMLLFRYRTTKHFWILAAVIPCVFLMVSTPQLYLRYLAFGSPFDFGSNSHFFAPNNDVIWDPNYKGPSFSEYMENRTIGHLKTRFISLGFWPILFGIRDMAGKIWFRLFELGFFFFIIFKQSKKIAPSIVYLLTFIGGYSIIWFLYGSGRHLIILIPIVILVAVWMISNFSQWVPIKGFEQCMAIAAILYSLSQPLYPRLDRDVLSGGEYNPDEWSIWASKNIQGKVGLVEGSTLMLTNLPLDQLNRIEIKRIGGYPSFEEALKNFKDQGLQYVLITNITVKVRPYLKEIYEGKESPDLQLLASFDNGLFVPHAKIYKVIY